jgi:NhaP-type Na+/H+ or K+/H+ antiporter
MILSRADEETAGMAETLGNAMSAFTFLIFGATVVPVTLAGLTWGPIVFAVLALTVVRIVPVAIALLGLGARLPTVGFLAWFGPRGLASIVFAVLILQAGPIPHLDLILATITITIVISVYAHGVTALPLTNRYVAWAAAHPRHALHAAGDT